MYWLLLAIIVIFSTTIYYYRKLILQKAISYILQKALTSSPNVTLPPAGFTQLTNSSAIIKYTRLGKIYNFYVPYNVIKVLEMQGLKALAFRGDEIIDMTQQAGVPYLVSADDLSAERIEFTNEDGKVQTFTGNTIPHYPTFT